MTAPIPRRAALALAASAPAVSFAVPKPARAQATPRNLMGFKDGTNNLKLEDADLLREQLWAAAGDGAAWMAGGTYLVTRKIRMTIETWDRTSLLEQEQIFGNQHHPTVTSRSTDSASPAATATQHCTNIDVTVNT